MPAAKRRKLSPEVEETPTANEKAEETTGVPEHAENGQEAEPATGNGNPAPADSQEEGSESTNNTSTTSGVPTASADRLARFAALKSRASASAKSNLAEAKAEATRAAIDPSVLASLSRKSAIASHNLLKADTEEEGGTGAFERKRAWDYTIEESEKWDERVERKKAARNNNAFQDYSAEAAKMYDRQMRDLEKSALKDGGKNREEYDRQKAEILENAARTGGLEIVEMENGELVAIDKDGRFYADHDSTGFIEQKPKRENVDRLVDDLRKAEEARMKKRRDRGRDADEGDVTYINEKNKQFNNKLARFYDRYTTDIRESFERGTAI
ncbi:Pre-mRNA-splicing factor SYF2 [Elasticomyces elasticus]|uniref:Pre-mRNA-splicing factor SYF2 n=1 Tax=Exophiala sideris TaxID=1016849 RepID=A0ABR0JBL8_9EURO|nr:Pre-mRNA-splicing factor SYF2 [Elasticomyces elasticus]KAK5030544.1 Pre-mRNA-splicing factor SYF2 [Exophiala sideris]KAK5038598.1 Pre-mRNA-splicing factor SYF2 [Exophiala sideris]KAK5060479.1 Pre-mRNA-splicing factor SYF2 [Exophiala sideris]KAK5183391.1 Pre-mRNA-splicing factor SYF2 [Eurotiomycetes sp. CCFEE 6388]